MLVISNDISLLWTAAAHETTHETERDSFRESERHILIIFEKLFSVLSVPACIHSSRRL